MSEEEINTLIAYIGEQEAHVVDLDAKNDTFQRKLDCCNAFAGQPKEAPRGYLEKDHLGPDGTPRQLNNSGNPIATPVELYEIVSGRKRR